MKNDLLRLKSTLWNMFDMILYKFIILFMFNAYIMDNYLLYLIFNTPSKNITNHNKIIHFHKNI
jgi:hypothetical protein